MNDRILAVRRANALMTAAETDLPPMPFRRPIESGLRPVRRMAGGLWVGGTATLTSEWLQFGANGMNRALHSGVIDARVELAEVTDVRTRWGMVTRIITVSTPYTSLVLRCFGARDFAEQIRDAVRQAGS